MRRGAFGVHYVPIYKRTHWLQKSKVENKTETALSLSNVASTFRKIVKPLDSLLTTSNLHDCYKGLHEWPKYRFLRLRE